MAAKRAKAKREPTPEEPDLKKLILALEKTGCEAECNGGKPLMGRNNQPMRAAIWELWDIGRDQKSSWLNFHPDTDAYTDGMRTLAGKMLSILKREPYDGPPRADKELKPGLDDGVSDLTVGGLRKAVQDRWASAPELQRAIHLLSQVNARRAPRPPVAHIGLSPALRTSIAGHAAPLVLEPQGQPMSVEARRSLFLRPVKWLNVCGGAYAERPVLHRQILPDFRAFLAGVSDARAVFKFPVFWIGGRSGDGKSVLLMQLCKAALAEGAAAHFARFAGPAAFFDWLEAQHENGALAGLNQPLIAVVDDLHKVADWGRAIRLLENAATAQAHIGLITCSPTPERTLFLQDTDHVLQVTRSDSPQLRDEDYVVLAQHLGLEMTATNSGKAPLVERLFLSLPNVNARSLVAFAESLKARVEARVDRSNLLEQLLGMTLLDLGLPVEYVGPANAAWLDELAAETQLHIDPWDDGYRFGHPAIAAPMFEVLTSAPGETKPIELRLATTLSPMLARTPSLNGVVRVLQQVMARIPQAKLGDVTQVLKHIYELAQDTRVSSATAVAITRQMNRDKLGLDRHWRNLARTFRDRRLTAPETRAHLAYQLVAADNPEQADFNAALRALADPDLRLHMGRFLRSLLSARARQLGWTSTALQPALAWCASQPDSRTAQDILFVYLAHYPRDTRVRRQAIDYLRRTAPENLTAHSMIIAAKLIEEDAADRIATWLRVHRGSLAGATVLAALLAKPGDRWRRDALLFLHDAPRHAHALGQVMAVLLPHIAFDPTINAMVAQVARDLMDDPKVNFFHGLADADPEFDVNPYLAARLDVLWSDFTQRDPSPEAFDLLRTCWNRLAAETPEVPQRVDWMFHRMSQLDSPSDAAPAKSRIDNTLRHALEVIVSSDRHVELYLPAALRYLETAPDTPLRGFVAARILLFVHAPAPPPDDLLAPARRRAAEAAEICWARADPHRESVRDGAFCAAALARTRWEVEPERVRELMLGYWQPSVRHGADRAMGGWLSVEAARKEAWSLLLDESHRTDRWDDHRASVVARNLTVTFEAIHTGGLLAGQLRYLLHLLRLGVGDYEHNPSAAWSALQRIGDWPASAEAALWQGILRSALEGATVTRDLYWDTFERWQAVHRDEHCERLIAGSSFESLV